jgi:hypothetical protein
MNEMYEKLVDLYAGHELDEEGEALLAGSAAHASAARDLRRVVDALRSDPGPEFTEETSTRVLLLMQLRGAPLPPAESSPEYQLRLPM